MAGNFETPRRIAEGSGIRGRHNVSYPNSEALILDDIRVQIFGRAILGLRKLCLIVAMIFLASVSARAQGLGDKIELSGGYGYMHFKSTPASSLNGFDASGQWKFFNWLGAVADVGGEYGKVNGVNSQLYTFLFGPQISWPHRISPFAHALAGLSRFSGGDFKDRSTAFAFGVGVDYHVSGRFSWRVIQADALTTRLGGRDEHNTRVSTGIVFRF